MSHEGLGKSLRQVLMTAAAGAMLGSAHAAVYTGNWDPAYGVPFPNLGWRGEANFAVPDGCGTPAVLSVFDCPGMAVLDAKVVFYDTSVSGPAPALASLFWPVAAGPSPPAPLFLATFAGGMLSSVWSGYLGPGLVPDSSFADIDDFEFHLEFLPTGARLTHYRTTLPAAQRVQQCALAAEAIDYENYCGFSNSDGAAPRQAQSLSAGLTDRLVDVPGLTLSQARLASVLRQACAQFVVPTGHHLPMARWRRQVQASACTLGRGRQP
jgi:hypothetical protein